MKEKKCEARRDRILRSCPAPASSYARNLQSTLWSLHWLARTGAKTQRRSCAGGRALLGALPLPFSYSKQSSSLRYLQSKNDNIWLSRDAHAIC